MSTTTLKIGLFDPGMSAMHRAGLGGMAMSLAALRDRPIEGLEHSVGEDTITLRFDEDNATTLVDFVEASMYCERGLIRFAAFPGQTQPELLHMNECLLGTLLQHNKMLEPSGAKKMEVTVDIDGTPYVFRVKQLEDFVHRYTARNKLVDDAGRLTTKPVKIKGWAVPGAVQRHSKVAATTLFEPPERLLPLLFAPIGVIPMRVVGNVTGGKYRFVLLIPEVTRLDQFASKRKRMSSSDNMICAGPGDASLRFFAEFAKAKRARRLPGHCTAVSLGKLTWSSQQMTRTDVLELDAPDARALDTYNIIVAHTPFKMARSTKGQGFRAVSSWRHFLTENLAAGQPLWSGLHHVTAVNAAVRKRMFGYEKRQIQEIVNKMSEQELLGNEAQQRFVEAWHQAIRQRWGQLHTQVETANLDRGHAFERDFESMRVALARCKNAASFRAAVVDIWARAGQNRVLHEHWREMLTYFGAESWQLGRDLALLALASYRGKRDETPEDQADEEEIEQ